VVTDASETDPFDEHLADWLAYTRTPWARVRYAVVAETLARHLPGQGGPLRVLDVGGGDGQDSLPLAAAGHDVTLVDTSSGMLTQAERSAADLALTDRLRTVQASLDDLSIVGDRDDGGDDGGDDDGDEGGFDVVLCHFVLHYREPGNDVARLAALVRPGGLLSLIAPNPASRVLQTLVRQGPAAALDQLESDAWESVTFAHAGRQYTAAEAAGDVAATGLDVVARYGGRIANDLLTHDDKKHEPDYYAALERLEIALCDRDPFRDIGMFWQLVAARPEGT
jgi:S-adenosylmethionine-dependent methyltransferase